ncbi:MAG TPA: hypothetical protein VNE38_13060 [Ktedonobacteraceae bacterium]|nr:hypothetical protein [Ktedonobacteraceae bacterium]
MKQPHWRIGATKLPCLMFTLDELLLLKKSLVLLKQLLVTNQEPLSNSEFAHETIMNLQRKLYQIMGSFEYGEGVPLDRRKKRCNAWNCAGSWLRSGSH